MDDTRPMPSFPQNERIDYQELAKSLVRQVVDDDLDAIHGPSNSIHANEQYSYDVYVVWFCKTLQNWKAMVCTTRPDNQYFEVTHNGDLRETYIDTYVKTDNRKILDSEI